MPNSTTFTFWNKALSIPSVTSRRAADGLFMGTDTDDIPWLLLQKVESGMGCPDWHIAMHCLQLQRLLWIYSPGHAGVSWNERADRLASTADITSGLQFGRTEVLRGLGNFLTGHSITALIAWRKEEWRKEAADIPPSKVEISLCSTRHISALFQGQPWGDCWEKRWSAYGPFRALWFHLELKLKLKHGWQRRWDLIPTYAPTLVARLNSLSTGPLLPLTTVPH